MKTLSDFLTVSRASSLSFTAFWNKFKVKWTMEAWWIETVSIAVICTKMRICTAQCSQLARPNPPRWAFCSKRLRKSTLLVGLSEPWAQLFSFNEVYDCSSTKTPTFRLKTTRVCYLPYELATVITPFDFELFSSKFAILYSCPRLDQFYAIVHILGARNLANLYKAIGWWYN